MKLSKSFLKKAVIAAVVASVYGMSGGHNSALAAEVEYVPIASNAAHVAKAQQQVRPTTDAQDKINSPVNQPEALKLETK